MLTFNAPLQTSLVPTRALGSSTPTFTRASTATIIDHEGILRLCGSGEARFYGARRVHNLLATVPSFSDWNNWATNGRTSLVTGKSDPFGGTNAAEITATNTNGQFYATAGSPFCSVSHQGTASLFVRRVSGSGVVQLHLPNNTLVPITITTSWQRFADTTAFVGGNGYIGIFIGISGDVVEISHPQLEIVSGAINQAPSEWVGFGGWGPGAAPYYGANADGVRYFSTENGNSVASNVVTEATGDAIADDTLQGYLSESQRTNRCLYSEDFTNAAWVKTACTISANSIAAPDGATTADTLTATGANATVVQDLGAVGSAWKEASIWLKRKTGTGNVDLTINGGTNWNTVAVTTSWTRFFVRLELANEDIGIRLVTNGDEVYAWGAQVTTDDGSNAFYRSYVPTVDSAVTANEDSLSYAYTGNISNTEGTVYGETRMGTSSGGALRLVGDVVSSGTPLSGRIVAPNILVELWDEVASTVSQIATTDARYKCASTWKTSGNKVPYINGTAGSGNAYDGSYFAGNIYIGAGGSAWLCAPLRNVRIWDEVLPIGPTGFPIQPVLGGMMSSLYASKFKNADSITPHDTNRADYDALSVGADGNVQVDTEDGSTVVIYMAAGVIYPIKVIRVYSTNTTATSIVGYR